MRCPDCWHPHLHAGRWHRLGERARWDQDPEKLVCPTCHPAVGTEGFDRAVKPLHAHLDTVSKRVT